MVNIFVSDLPAADIQQT